jgi:hypothetical protein
MHKKQDAWHRRIAIQLAGQLPEDTDDSFFKDFSQTCQAAMLRAKAVAVAKECSTDIKQRCAAVKPGGSRIEAYLRAHLTGLSDDCKGPISGARGG